MKNEEYRAGSWRIFPAELRLELETPQGRRVETLPPKVFEVLLYLVQSPGQTVARQRLIDEIWQGNVAVGSRGITNAIYQLRKLLADGESEVIRTIAKTGYQLLLPVTLPEPEAGSEPEPTQSQPNRFDFPHWPVAILTLALLLAVAAWQWWPKTQSLPKAISYGQPVPLTYLDGVEETPTLSPDGRYLAFMWERANEPARIFIQDLIRPEASLRQISFSEYSESSPTWSPDGKKIAFVRLDPTGRCDVWIKTLATLEEHRITTCVQPRFHRVLDWSPSGRYLAMIDKAPNSEQTVVFLYDLETHERRQISEPESGQWDNQLVWAHGRDELAFVRFLGGFRADLYRIATEGEATRLTWDEASIHGLSWSRDDQSIVFNSMRDGGHSLWQLFVDEGHLRPLHRDQTPFNIVALAEQDHYAYVRHAALEYLQGWNGQMEKAISSAGRDLYGTLSPDGQRLAFLSNRTGRFEIWVAQKDGRAARPLTQREGVRDLPAWSPDGDRLVVTLARPEGVGSQLVMFNLEENQRKILLQDGHQYRNPYWSADGKSLLISSTRSGAWQIWRLDLISGQLSQLTEDGGVYAQEDGKGDLYYSRPNESGLWRKAPTGESERVILDLASNDWGNWTLQGNEVVYLRRHTDADQLVRWEPDESGSDAYKVIGSFERGSIKINRSLSMDGQGRIMLTRLGRQEANILAISPRSDSL
ncbi:winged helix-turn-helix domain-containing protein [Ferrimonas gelatinilytica]|uniref:Winged helix-turn-helix domain-containing protein n=1 Tax=Ferrimonas gelatinilytica TaxID=1255257 RepID=A0ABP9S0R1_9GAMM